MKNLKSIIAILFSLNIVAQQSTDYSRAPNSYIFDPIEANANSFSGIYIPVTKAYAMWSSYEYLKQNENFTPIPAGTQTAALFWEDVPGLVKNVSIVPGAGAENSKIKVEINRFLGNGNAVVAFKVNGTIYWSWHIWVTDNPANGVTYTQGFETDINNNPIQVQYMDRNLGALSNHFLGDNWQKSGGLMYQWGRKDPFPTLIYKDEYFYEIKSELGYLKHPEISSSTIPVVERPFDQIEKNIRYSVNNPLNYIVNADAANWFSNKMHKTEGSGTSYMSWDLWSDNYKGGNSNASSSNPAIKQDSRSYELKSQLDPCPNGWRIPSYYGRVTMNNNLSPFGRKDSGGNDDITPQFSVLYPDQDNPALNGVKVYPGLGMDFTSSQSGNRNIGIISISGNYEKYPNVVVPNAPLGVIYQDGYSDGGLWSTTLGYDGGRLFGMVSDQLLPFTNVGKHQIFVNQTNQTQVGNAVKCMKDPNLASIGNFPTEYYSEYENVVKNGFDNPNTYLITNQTEIHIPVNKPFAVRSQLFADQELPPYDNLKAKVFWATNTKTVTSLSIIHSSSNPMDDYIKVKIDPSEKGNFVISLHNGSTTNPAYWSWYFWIPETDPTQQPIKYITEKPVETNGNFVNATVSFSPPLKTIMMDRNLGAMKPFYAVSDQDFIRKTKGLLFQWGRKDAIPSFQDNAQGIIYLGNDNLPENAQITYKTLTSAQYDQQFTREFNVYNAGIPDKNTNAKVNIKYSIANPLTFLYRAGIGQLYNGGNHSSNDLTKIKDWVSNTRSLLNERWGHGGKKSPFDPCPEGWRIPDVFGTILYTGSKGNSPFFNSYKTDWLGKPGVIQDQWADVVQSYSGSAVSGGWIFPDQKYPLGGIPADGIRGELGEKEYSAQRSGIWTASLADLQTGYALALLLENGKMQSGTGVYPQAAMSVRCAKDEPRYLGIPMMENNTVPAYLGDESVISLPKNAIYLYPNPFVDELYVNDSNAVSYQIFDMTGKLVVQNLIENKTIKTSGLLKGAYIVKIMTKDQNTITQKVLRK